MYAVSQDIATGRNTVRWESFTSYNMVSKMRYGNLTDTSNPTASTADRQLNFLHGPEHQRIKQQVSLSNNAPTSLHSGTTWYLHGDNNDLFYEKEIRYGGTIEHKHYLSAGGITFAIQTLREGTLNGKPQKTLNYLHHDHLGSTSAVTDETGTVIERMAYDPWGKRRFTNGTADTSDSIVPSSTDRGFTLHEHLDEMGIIHMNGRVYDPYTGRFMSADPFIQSPDNLQSYNRYAYVMNNPLNMTDPSGYFSLRKLFRAAVAIAVAYYTGQWVDNFVLSATCNPALASVAAGAAGGFAGGLAASGGNINAGLQGAFTGALFGAAGTVGNPNDNIRYAAHAAAGCVSAVAGGGKCGQGMTAAVFGKYTTNQIEGWGGANKNSVEWLIAKGVATSIAGGAGSVIAGGKFDNGAATAAFGYLFNQAMSHVLQDPESINNKSFANAKGNTECVEVAKQCFAAPQTKNWSPGEQVVGNDKIERGTLIATFVNEKYQGHTAVYLSQDQNGNIRVLDQWNAQGKVLERTIRNDSKRSFVNNANNYRVVEW
jgi:RHS repeat-associated protein